MHDSVATTTTDTTPRPPHSETVETTPPADTFETFVDVDTPQSRRGPLSVPAPIGDAAPVPLNHDSTLTRLPMLPTLPTLPTLPSVTSVTSLDAAPDSSTLATLPTLCTPPTMPALTSHDPAPSEQYTAHEHVFADAASDSSTLATLPTLAALPTLPTLPTADSNTFDGESQTERAPIVSTGHHPMAHLMAPKPVLSPATIRATELRAKKRARAKKIKIELAVGALAVAVLVGPPLTSWFLDALNQAGTAAETSD